MLENSPGNASLIFMSKPCSIVFVRHAYTNWNLSGLTMGQTDVPATEKAIGDAKTAAKNYMGKPSWIVSSPLGRARETAEQFSSKLKAPLFIDSLWMERHWGAFESQPKTVRHASDATEGVEEWGAFVDRVVRGLSALPRHGEGMVVSHSGVYRVLISLGYRSNYSANSPDHAFPVKLSLET